MRLSIFFVVLAASVAAGATDINDLARAIAANNPSVRATNESLNAEILNGKSENQLDAPEIEFEHLFAGKGVKDKTGVSLTQSFDWPGIYRARSQAIDSRVRATRFHNLANIAEIALEAKISLIEAVYLKKRLALTDSIAANVNRILADTERGFVMGVYTRLDINRLKIEKLDISARRNAILVRLEQIEAILSDLNGGNPAKEIITSIDAYPIESLEPLESYIEMIQHHDPSLAAARANIEAADKEKAVSSMSRLPGWSIGYKYSREEGHSFNGFSLGISLPFLTRNYAGRGAAATMLASQYEYQAAMIKATSEAVALHAEAVRLGEAAAEYAEVFEKSDNIRLLSKAYQGKQLSSVEYLNDINYFLSGYESYLENAFSYAVALARVNRLRLISEID